MAVRKQRKPARKAAAKKPPVPKIKTILPINPQDAQNIMAFLQRIDLKGSEVAAFNRAQVILAHACGAAELTQEQLNPPVRNSQ